MSMQIQMDPKRRQVTVEAVVIPRIDMSKCDGCGSCTQVCPNNVLQVRIMTREEKRRLGFWARLKTSLHGNRKCYIVNADICSGCGICAEACRRMAIQI